MGFSVEGVGCRVSGGGCGVKGDVARSASMMFAKALQVLLTECIY